MLAAPHHSLRNRVVAAVDNFRAEPVKLSFMVDGGLDPARPARDIEAILNVKAGESAMVSGGNGRDWRGAVSSQRSALHVDRAKYPDLVVRKGDKVRALARPGQPWFEVLAVDDRGDTRLVLQLGEA